MTRKWVVKERCYSAALALFQNLNVLPLFGKNKFYEMVLSLTKGLASQKSQKGGAPRRMAQRGGKVNKNWIPGRFFWGNFELQYSNDPCDKNLWDNLLFFGSKRDGKFEIKKGSKKRGKKVHFSD